jgi:hypothetical protein
MVFTYWRELGTEMKNEYQEGPEALKKFEDGMKKLFQASKPASPFKPPPAKPKEQPSKD